MKEQTPEPCDLCGRWGYLQTHHIFEGISLRRKSEQYKQYCTIRVCYQCHEDIHRHPLKYLYLKENAQRELMEGLGWTMTEWRLEFGKSYLEENQ